MPKCQSQFSLFLYRNAWLKWSYNACEQVGKKLPKKLFFFYFNTPISHFFSLELLIQIDCGLWKVQELVILPWCNLANSHWDLVHVHLQQFLTLSLLHGVSLCFIGLDLSADALVRAIVMMQWCQWQHSSSFCQTNEGGVVQCWCSLMKTSKTTVLKLVVQIIICLLSQSHGAYKFMDSPSQCKIWLLWKQKLGSELMYFLGRGKK